MIPGDPTALLTAPSEGIYIYGMYLEGCAWDSGVQELCESRPKVLTEPAPVVWLKPMQLTEFSSFPHFSCPVYRTAERKGAYTYSMILLVHVHLACCPRISSQCCHMGAPSVCAFSLCTVDLRVVLSLSMVGTDSTPEWIHVNNKNTEISAQSCLSSAEEHVKLQRTWF